MTTDYKIELANQRINHKLSQLAIKAQKDFPEFTIVGRVKKFTAIMKRAGYTRPYNLGDTQMPVKQHDIEHAKTMMSNFNPDELTQVRDWIDNQLHEKDPNGSSRTQDINNSLSDMDENELTELRSKIDDRLLESRDDTQGSADASADDEKKKYIAQNGTNPLAQTTAQNVPQPESDEVKDLQNQKAEEEHQAKGEPANAAK
jgi:hypothetical protein